MSVLSQLLSFLSQEPPCSPAQPHLRRLYLPVTPTTSEPITCVYYDSRHYVTGTDIIRALVFRFRLEAIPIGSLKKFEEGVFSDLRTLKPGVGAILEAPRSEFLQLLHRFGCIRTQKKQKVFLWKFVDFERLFKEAEKRERKRHADDLALSSLAATAAMGLVGEELKEWKKMQPFWTSTLPLPITVELLPRHNSFFPSPTTSPSPLPHSPESADDEDEMMNKIQQQLWAMMSTSPELVAAAAQALLISSTSPSSTNNSSSTNSSVPSLVSSPSLSSISSAYGIMESPSPKMMVRSTGGNRILMQPPTPPHPFSLHQSLDEWSGDDLLEDAAEETGITSSLDQFLNDLATVQQATPQCHDKVMDYVAPWWVSEAVTPRSPSCTPSTTRRFHPYSR